MDGNVYGFVFDFDERQKQIVTAATILKKEKLPHGSNVYIQKICCLRS